MAIALSTSALDKLGGSHGVRLTEIVDDSHRTRSVSAKSTRSLAVRYAKATLLPPARVQQTITVAAASVGARVRNPTSIARSRHRTMNIPPAVDERVL